jgi:streptogramin lyase
VNRQLALIVGLGICLALVARGNEQVARAGDADNSIRALSPITTYPLGPGTVSGVAYGAGSVWIMTLERSRLPRVDAKTGKIVAQIKIGASPGYPVSHYQVEDSVVFADGFAWVRDSVNREIVRVSPGRNRVVARIRTGLP